MVDGENPPLQLQFKPKLRLEFHDSVLIVSQAYMVGEISWSGNARIKPKEMENSAIEVNGHDS